MKKDLVLLQEARGAWVEALAEAVLTKGDNVAATAETLNN